MRKEPDGWSARAHSQRLVAGVEPRAAGSGREVGGLNDTMQALAPSPDVLGAQAFFLFTPFYTPSDAGRAAELLHCLRRNLESGIFARIILMIDDETVAPFEDHRIITLRLRERPTYLDWILAARRFCPGHVAVLANSDIFVCDSFEDLAVIFEKDPRAFIALTRFEKKGEGLEPHPNPHWSQDTWAYVPKEDDETTYDAQLSIPLGVPRCDNKIAYLFSIQGYTVYNPFPFVQTVHVHETGLRSYSKTGDRRLLGGVAYVRPGPELTSPAQLELDVWTRRSTQVTQVKVNSVIEKWEEEARVAATPQPTWIAHDADWQYPAITEQHAFNRLCATLPSHRVGLECIYLAFPFATLIDLKATLTAEHPRTRELQARLDALAREAKRYKRVVAICQHIRARQYSSIFAAAGVTDLFWSHAEVGRTPFEGNPPINVHPFPLYPVQQVPRGVEDFERKRRYLFSFVGARSHPNYLTNVREMLLDQLRHDPRGKVLGRDQWHYQQIVYDAQVRGRVDAATPGLVNDGDSAEFRSLLDESTFSLCPSGSGPNSIRLWEAMMNGSIPVILSDTWQPPGDPALWAEATLRVPETPEAIALLPEAMSEIAKDQARYVAMRHSLNELAGRCGPEAFVDDVVRLIQRHFGK